VFFQREY